MGTAATFGLRVARCKTLKGFEVLVFWSHRDESVVIAARHPYGLWKSVRVTRCSRGVIGFSENNAPMCASDVAFRLRRAIRDKGKF